MKGMNMIRKATLIAWAFGGLLGGCSHEIDTNQDNVAIKEIASDVPQFKREYSSVVDSRRCTVKITARTWWPNHRLLSGELDQPDGKWLLFDVDEVADKIVDPVLVPLIEKEVAKIKKMDEAYIDSKPNEFTDEQGTVWRRVP